MSENCEQLLNGVGRTGSDCPVQLPLCGTKQRGEFGKMVREWALSVPRRFHIGEWTTAAENGLHYRCDVTFREDRTRMTRGNTGRVTAILNNLVINLLRLIGADLAQARRLKATDLPTTVRLVTTSPLRL
jgi:hypothetical protein